MNIEALIKNNISQAFHTLYNYSLPEQEIELQPTRKEFEGSVTFVTFSYSKISKQSPEQTAKALGEYLKQHAEAISDFNVVKGFLNISVSDMAWLAIFREQLVKENFAVFAPNKQTVMVEYSSPNTNKPLHLGHLRNNFLGYSVAAILMARGYEVIKANLVNDRGIHICKSMIAYQKLGNGETPQTSGLKGDHLIGKYYVLFDKLYKQQIEELVGGGMDKEQAEKEASIMKEAQQMLIKWEEGDKEIKSLWKQMNGWVYEGFDATYKAIGVDFDKFYYESETYLLGKDIVEEGLSKNVFYKKENGSVWVDLTSDGLDEKLLLRADGTSVYITQDLGTADLKYNEYGADKSIYVVGNEQDYHFKVLILILKKLGRTYADGIYHLSYGMVDLPSGRMKSREGTVVDADDLVQEMTDTAERYTKELGKIEGFSEVEAKELYRTVGLGALKYFLLKVDPKKRMLFNPEESVEFQGNTGPFIQYTFARISAIIRKANQLGIHHTIESFVAYKSLHTTEKEVIILLNQFPEKIDIAAAEYSPSVIAQYVYDLAKEYNRFYAEVSIFNEEDKEALSFRIAFSDVVAKVIQRSMFLLGIKVPERM